MAAHSVHGPSNDEMLRYQAEDMAREAMKESPMYKEAVATAMRHLKEAQGEIKKMGKRMPMKKGSRAEHSRMASVAPPGVAK